MIGSEGKKEDVFFFFFFSHLTSLSPPLTQLEHQSSLEDLTRSLSVGKNADLFRVSSPISHRKREDEEGGEGGGGEGGGGEVGGERGNFLLFVLKLLGGLSLTELFLWFINSRGVVEGVWEGVGGEEQGGGGEEFVCKLYQAAAYLGVAKECLLGMFFFCRNHKYWRILLEI